MQFKRRLLPLGCPPPPTDQHTKTFARFIPVWKTFCCAELIHLVQDINTSLSPKFSHETEDFLITELERGLNGFLGLSLIDRTFSIHRYLIA